MANAASGPKKPRIRKTAPTMREVAEQARAKEQQSIQKAERRRPKSSLKLPANVQRVGKGPARVLGWLTPKYFIGAWREVRQVQWPNRRETWRLTLAVFVFAIIFGALVAGVDKGLDEVFKKLVLK